MSTVFNKEDIEMELRTFDQLRQGSTNGYVTIESPSEHAAILSPKGRSRNREGIRLTVSSLVHGNEIVGLAVVNEIFKQILSGSIRIAQPIAITVGNRRSALLNARFTERDLNRSFGTQETKTYEDRLSKELENIFLRSDYIVDLHQTIEPTVSSFFVIRYTEQTLNFAYHLDRTLPIVASLARTTSADGKTLTEFAKEHGVTGVTIELGQKGYDPEQFQYGVKFCRKALDLCLNSEAPLPLLAANDLLQKLNVWTINAYYRPHGKGAVLDPGWRNFSDISQGQRVGIYPATGEIITAPETGKMLFPKYGSTASELFGIIQKYQEQP